MQSPPLQRLFGLFFAAALLAACGSVSSPDSDETSGGAPNPEQTHQRDAGTSGGDDAGRTDTPRSSCRPSAQLRQLHGRVSDSLQSLERRGATQVRLAGHLMLRLLLENGDLYDSKTRRQLQSMLDWAEMRGMYEPGPDLTPGADGAWHQLLGPRSRLRVRFFDPAGGPIEANVFDIESYFRGIRLEYDMSFEEMQRHPSTKNSWTITWNEPGPLFHLLGAPDAVPNPFVVHASLSDLAALASGPDGAESADPEFGPLESLLDVRVEATLDLDRRLEETTIQYTADTRRRTLRRTLRTRSVDFRIASLRASDDSFLWSSEESRLAYRGDDLAGTLHFDVLGGGDIVGGRLAFAPDESTTETRWDCTRTDAR